MNELESLGAPYRSVLATSPEVVAQMSDALDVLHELRKFRPVIAGGALWSWAAGKRAKDVDVFVRDGWRMRRLLRKKGLIVNGQSIKLSKKKRWEYGHWWKDIKTRRYCGCTSKNGTSLDIVLVPWLGSQHVVDFFDYQHCMVMFSSDMIRTDGADSYITGELRSRFDSSRNEALVEAKLTKELWGDPDAERCLLNVIGTLNALWSMKEHAR